MGRWAEHEEPCWAEGFLVDGAASWGGMRGYAGERASPQMVEQEAQ